MGILSIPKAIILFLIRRRTMIALILIIIGISKSVIESIKTLNPLIFIKSLGSAIFSFNFHVIDVIKNIITTNIITQIITQENKKRGVRCLKSLEN